MHIKQKLKTQLISLTSKSEFDVQKMYNQQSSNRDTYLVCSRSGKNVINVETLAIFSESVELEKIEKESIAM